MFNLSIHVRSYCLIWHSPTARVVSLFFMASNCVSVLLMFDILQISHQVKNLPKGATVIDYAYQIHTDVGNKMVAAKVRRESIKPQSYVLLDGLILELPELLFYYLV